MNWASRDVVGPNCTAEQAAVLFQDMIYGNPWPNMEHARTDKVADKFAELFTTFPHSCCVKAVQQIIRKEKFFPVWAIVQEYIEAEWRAANKVGHERRGNDEKA